MCEIQALGYGTNPYLVWANETADLARQPWSPEFQATGVQIHGTIVPGQAAIILILARNENKFSRGRSAVPVSARS
jgi:hypothetical protein